MTALHRALDDGGPVPRAYWLSRICEEFQCVPSVALREAARLPVGLLEDIVEARHYAIAKAQFEGATSAAELAAMPPSELRTLAKTITFELVAEARRG